MCVITEKKLQLNIARLCCRNFLSLVVFRLGKVPGPSSGYAYAPSQGSLMNKSVILKLVEAYTSIFVLNDAFC